jgi:hypothetical protein
MTTRLRHDGQEYAVEVDGELVGYVRRGKDSYSGMGLGTHTYWRARTPDRRYTHQLGGWHERTYELVDGYQTTGTKHSTRAEAVNALLLALGLTTERYERGR